MVATTAPACGCAASRKTVLLHDSYRGARHAVLRHLVDQVGESCNLTALSGSEVVYLDRVETAAPLRFYLHPGLARAGALLGQRQAVPESDGSRPAPAPAGPCAAGGLHARAP
jgi:hypothetical protein